MNIKLHTPLSLKNGSGIATHTLLPTASVHLSMKRL